MKRILITGVNSYVGNSFAEWMKQYPEDYKIDKISLRDGFWRDMDFSKYDSILHVSGIAHRKETKKNAYLYYEVNRDLTIEIARKAKNEGVSHFIFLSTMSVYGLTEGVINKNTPLKPKSHYGKSKVQAEEFLNSLTDESFKVAILRPPMIYGNNCTGNYQKLRSLASKTPIFPEIRNKRSMIYIDNFSECIRNIIINSEDGCFHPQNKSYVSTTQLVKEINRVHNKKKIFTTVFNPIIKIIKTETINKVFGNLIYDQTSFEQNYNYQIYKFKCSVIKSENMEKKV